MCEVEVEEEEGDGDSGVIRKNGPRNDKQELLMHCPYYLEDEGESLKKFHWGNDLSVCVFYKVDPKHVYGK